MTPETALILLLIKITHSFFPGTIFSDAKDGYFDIEVGDHRFFPHPKYNTLVPPKYVLDVALIKLDRRLQMDKKLHTVCLWNSTYTSMYYFQLYFFKFQS